MANWVKCTSSNGAVYINVETAAALSWNENFQLTVVSFANDEEPVHVRETPEEILRRAGENYA